ncbi:hypothetical protein [Clostridium estertheticum]|uniref:hypothetical protein n=1 Tax=Clostridium estertheticum TaxID=238834 RepID=UPI001C0D5066|nr:hypothetical protein [Clostridium estertheticum]MBU3073870.1 hypothetical protein [Clostridium estertheticum]MBU3163965.1 hypothetical protein [Clostridium estertheticum]
MKEPEMILGYAIYDSEKYPFVYEKGILNLLPGTEIELKKQKRNLFKDFAELSKFKIKHEWISNDYIEGTTSDGKSILFISNGGSGNNNGFIQYDIRFIYEYESNSLNGKLISGLIIKADEIDYFFNPSRVFNGEISFNENDSLREITVKSVMDSKHTMQCGSYNSGDISITVEISAYSTYSSRSENPLSAQSQICLEFDKPVDLHKALEIIYHQESFLNYISYRKNVNIREVSVFEKNENELRRNVGEIYINRKKVIETNKRKTKEVLTFELLEGKIAPILQAIAEGKVYLEHLCTCIDDKSSYNVANIILLFAAFEREYNNIFSSRPIRSKEYLDLKADVLELLENHKKECKNRKLRKYISGFKKIINNSDNSLSERIKNAITDNINIMEMFLHENYQTVNKELIDDISLRMNSMRNDIAHGNLDLKIEPIHISDFGILKILIYVMRLNSMDISVKSIQKGICKLFGYNIYIPDEPKDIHAVKATNM